MSMVEIKKCLSNNPLVKKCNIKAIGGQDPSLSHSLFSTSFDLIK